MAQDLKALEQAFAAAIELHGAPLRVFLTRLWNNDPLLAATLEQLLESDALDDSVLLGPVDAAVAHWSKANAHRNRPKN